MRRLDGGQQALVFCLLQLPSARSLRSLTFFDPVCDNIFMPTDDSPGDRWLARLVRLLSYLPLPLQHALANSCYLLLFHITAYQRTLVTDNLRAAFPAASRRHIQRLARISYRHSLQILFEAIRARRMPRGQLLARVEFENPDELLRHLAAGHSVLALGAHQCNWEWLQLACSARFEVAVDAIYKPLNHTQLDTLLATIRNRFGTRLVAVDEVQEKLLARPRRQCIVALVADQGPRPDEKQNWFSFLGRDTAFYSGAETIARLLKTPVVFAGMKRVGRGRYRVRFETLCENPAVAPQGGIMQDYVSAVERQVRAAPEDWLWLYKRWKYQRPVYD